MPARAHLVVLACLVGNAIRVQEQPQPSAEAAPTAPTAREQVQRQRGRADIEAVCSNAKLAAGNFAGRVQFEMRDEGALPIGAIDERFTGGGSDEHGRWFRIRGHTCLSHGDHRIFNDERGRWRAPRGDEPDVPLTPALLLPHFLEADLGTPQPCMLEGRPAMRVHARFVGRPAKRVLMSATTPSSQVEQVIEALATAASRDHARYVVDATLTYDPAMRRWLSATLRLANLDGRPIPDDVLPPDAPEGLPHLTSFPLLEATWHIERLGPDEADRPTLDAQACQLLELPDAPAGPEAKRDDRGRR